MGQECTVLTTLSPRPFLRIVYTAGSLGEVRKYVPPDKQQACLLLAIKSAGPLTMGFSAATQIYWVLSTRLGPPPPPGTWEQYNSTETHAF